MCKCDARCIISPPMSLAVSVTAARVVKVGTIVFVPTVLPGGFVTDMLLPISFVTEIWDEAKIGECVPPHPWILLISAITMGTRVETELEKPREG